MAKIKNKFAILHDRNGKKYRVLSSKLKFRPSVYGIIIKNNKILLSKQWDGYDFPGGGVELGETLEAATKREIWEETGLKVKISKLVYCGDSFFRALNVKMDMHAILIYYLCDIVGGKLSIENFDEYEKQYADMPEWIDIKDIRKIKFYNSVNSLEIIKKALKLCQKK